MSTTSPAATTTVPVMSEADAAMVRAHLPPEEAARFDAALADGNAIDAAFNALDAAGYAGSDHRELEALRRI